MAVWPESATRHRHWCHPRDAAASCKHEWMRDALRRWGGKFHPELDLDLDAPRTTGAQAATGGQMPVVPAALATTAKTR